jgi:hypothetical protein
MGVWSGLGALRLNDILGSLVSIRIVEQSLIGGDGICCGLLAAIRVLDVVQLKVSYRPVLFVLSFAMVRCSEDGEREGRKQGCGGGLHLDLGTGSIYVDTKVSEYEMN